MARLLTLIGKHKELIPLVAAVGGAAVGATSFALYSLGKPGLVARRDGGDLWEDVDPERPQKLLTVHQLWRAIPELEEVRRIERGVEGPRGS
ncbi:conserved hypothetical pox protein [Squirrelpox virus]|uniref:Conserved hypothetical pox protein n=1 Tax=Squirrelpox virus TaxID=240426 RepID=U3UBJ1_9POXV|nr:conserved hypothetical pox protein [Squirrelpox virus]CCD83261.1 conserved hypothetical pox protein [Squirrelpox virus]